MRGSHECAHLRRVLISGLATSRVGAHRRSLSTSTASEISGHASDDWLRPRAVLRLARIDKAFSTCCCRRADEGATPTWCVRVSEVRHGRGCRGVAASDALHNDALRGHGTD